MSAYLVFKGLGKSEDTISTTPNVHITKFLNKSRSGNSQYAVSTNSSTVGADHKLAEQDIQDEFKRLYMQLEQLKEKNMRHGNRHLAARINAMQEAGRLQTSDENEETSLVKSDGSSSPNVTSGQCAKTDRKGDVACSISTSKMCGKPPEAIINNNCFTVEPGEGSTSKPASSARSSSAKTSNSSAPAKPTSKMPIRLNLDDMSRFTEEVTV